ncbi:MAG: gliding motility-associated C-terminal domain-containing protein, partial [Saprospiraceae bacterium]
QAKSLLGCFSFDTIRVEVVFGQQTAEAVQICAGDSVLIFGNYQTVAGAYAQTFSAANGCDSAHTVSLVVLPVFQTAEAVQICAGDSVLIFGNYQTAAGVYAQTFSAANGCDSAHTVSLAVLPVFQTAEAVQICAGDSVLIFGNYQTAAGVYSQKFQASGGCDSVVTVSVQILPEPVLDLVWLDPTCFGESDGQLNIESAPAGAVFGLDGAPFDTAEVYLNLAAGLHILRVRDTSGCVWEAEASLSEPPPVSVVLPNDTLIQQGQVLKILPETAGGVVQFIWSPGTGLDCSICASVAAAPMESTLYTLTVSNATGCTATDQILVEVWKSTAIPVYVPNVIQPGISGPNSVWTLSAGAAVLELREVAVYDRWGNLQYRWDTPLPPNQWPGWDGTARGGQKAAPGVYVYYLKLLLANREVAVIKGDLTVAK